MRKDFDDDFSFLDELEPVKRTKEKKSGSGKKKTRAVLNHKEESKKTVKKSSAKAVKGAERGKADKADEGHKVCKAGKICESFRTEAAQKEKRKHSVDLLGEPVRKRNRNGSRRQDRRIYRDTCADHGNCYGKYLCLCEKCR